MGHYIKNMMCSHCKMMAQIELEQLGLHYSEKEPGIAEVKEDITSDQRYDINKALVKYGMELVKDKKSMLIDKIKTCIDELVNNSDEQFKTNLSYYIRSKLGHSYTYLSNVFSEGLGISIEKYYIHQKIERVKNLLLFEQLSLKEIRYRLNYCSVAHLSAQFKKVTGLTPSQFKELKNKKPVGITLMSETPVVESDITATVNV